MADKKQKRKTSVEQKKAYTVCTPDATPQQLKSVYTGRDKATVENHLKFVSIVINRTRQQFTVGDLARRGIQCRQHH